MQREIKFRDYDFETKTIRYFDLDSYNRYEHDSYGNIMQFTGLIDANGENIYEGDIMCGGKYLNTQHQSNWIVKFDAEKGYKTWHSHPIDDAIVIGNIHENPDLLNS